MAKTNLKASSDVYAQRGDKKQVFSRSIWDLLGPNKQGWEELKETPAELLGNSDTPPPTNNIEVTPENVLSLMVKVDAYLKSLSADDRERLYKEYGDDARKTTAAVDPGTQSAVVKTLSAAQAKKAETPAKATGKTKVEADATNQAENTANNIAANNIASAADGNINDAAENTNQAKDTEGSQSPEAIAAKLAEGAEAEDNGNK